MMGLDMKIKKKSMNNKKTRTFHLLLSYYWYKVSVVFQYFEIDQLKKNNDQEIILQILIDYDQGLMKINHLN